MYKKFNSSICLPVMALYCVSISSIFSRFFYMYLFFVSAVGLSAGIFSPISFFVVHNFPFAVRLFPFCIASIFVGLVLLINKAIL